MPWNDAGRTLLRSLTKHRFVSAPVARLSRAGLLPAAIWRRLPVSKQLCGVRLPDGKSFRFIADDYPIGRALFWTGISGWEAETTPTFLRLAQRARLFLDIGANTGVYSLLACAANPEVTVIAFEPTPDTHRQLVANIEVNGWRDRCAARKEAVSNFSGSAKLHVPAGRAPSSASLHPGGFRQMRGDELEVPVTTIDSLVSGGQPVDLVKIDVEGLEDKVLEGMQGVLARSLPDIIVECNQDGPFRAVEALLAGFGYKFFHLQTQGPIATASILPDSREVFRNFLCTARGNF